MKQKQYCYDYPRPALTVDCVVFGYHDGELNILLIERNADPFKDTWALPGGFVGMEETTGEAALRELREETGLENVFLEQLYTFSAVERDPRGRVVSVVYYALVALGGRILQAATDAGDARWFPWRRVPILAFDHAQIVETAIARLKAKVRYQPLGFELLPEKFTLTQLQQLYETLLEQPIDKRNFRKKILAMDLLKSLDEFRQGQNRPAQLYQFDRQKYHQLEQSGFNFDL